MKSDIYLISVKGDVKSTADSLSGVATSDISATCTSPLTIIPITPVQDPFLSCAPEEPSTDLM